MKIFTTFLAAMIAAWCYANTAHALSIEDIIKLKRAGVSDSTIELLIKRAGDARSAGVWKQDGWIVYSTESRFPDNSRRETFESEYPIEVYPQIDGAARPRPR
ncbi:MAG TPA: hypothetical protein VHM64_00435 [Candidatus Binatia bacterium]|nr:hypothetical protein [Candidatus Binatia bacterium]